jgi:hypothetical protein
MTKKSSKYENTGAGTTVLNAPQQSHHFTVGTDLYVASDQQLENWHSIPENVLRGLTFGERRLLHYLSGKPGHDGVCYVKSKKHFTRRYIALTSLLRKGLVELTEQSHNVAHFRLPKHFDEQHKFIIASCSYDLTQPEHHLTLMQELKEIVEGFKEGFMAAFFQHRAA